MNGYSLDEKFFAYAEEDHKIKPVHVAVYAWIKHRANKSGWKKVIDIQTERSMDVLGITDWRTYKNALQYLDDCGLIVWVEKSKNQYTCNRISLTDKALAESDASKLVDFIASAKNVKAIAEAIVEAHAEADVKAIAEALQSYINSKTDKPKTNKQQSAALPDDTGFDEFWKKYDKKVDRKPCLTKWRQLTPEKREAILQNVEKYVKANPDTQYRKNPLTYLNRESWSDEIPAISTNSNRPSSAGFNLGAILEQQSKKVHR